MYADLNEARRILNGPPEDLSGDSIASARSRIESARRRLEGPAADLLRALPVVGANLDAVDAAAAGLVPVISSAEELNTRFRAIESEGLLAGGAIRLDALAALNGPLADQQQALGTLAATVARHRTGILVPPLWSALDRLVARAAELGDAAGNAGMLLAITDDLFGANGERTYVVALINNAELRGAGGVLTGLGTITARDGRLRLDKLFDHLEFSRGRPLVEVDAPPEYIRRYGEFKANTSLTLNASFSPDVPDVAVVAAEIYEAIKGTSTDGALVVDPRGLAALMPSGQEVSVRGTDETITKDSLARFVYSDAYELFDSQSQRRRALIDVGRKAFEATLQQGLGDRSSLSDAAAAFAGGHIRFVPFDPTEQDVLNAVGATGDLAAPESDAMLVAVQNFGTTGAGGTKLDYWAERAESHRCDLRDGGASCSTAVTISNATPEGLTTYVAGSPYGVMRDYVEVFVPERARLLSIEVDGRAAEYRLEAQSGYNVVGVYAAIEPGQSKTIAVDYELLDINDESGYEFVATPQPLARDARIDIEIDAPDGWVVTGPGSEGTDDYRYQGSFKSTVNVAAGLDERTGFSALWERLEFWE